MFPDKLEVYRDPVDPAFSHNDRYLVGLKPNVEKAYVRAPENGGETIHWSTNSDTFRGPELQPAPRARILVYGDSNIQARFSSLENTYPFRLQRYLETEVPGIEVINAGVVGFGTDQSLLRFESEVDRYRPDLVIFHVGDNDFGDLIRNRLFDLDADGTLLSTKHRRKVDSSLTDSQPFIESLFLVRAGNKAARTLGLIEPKAGVDFRVVMTPDQGFEVIRLRIEDEYRIYERSRPKAHSHFADYYDLDIALNSDAPSAVTKRRLLEAILRRAHEAAASRDIGFVVLIQPSAVDFTTTSLLLNHEWLAAHAPTYDPANLTTAVARICERNGIDHVNLFEAFANEDPESLFFKGRNDHWNDRGQDLAAAVTARHLREARPDLLASWSERPTNHDPTGKLAAATR